MHNLTKIDISEKKRRYDDGRDVEWQKIVRSSTLSGASVKLCIESSFGHLEGILNSSYAVEKDALIKTKSLPPDEYYLNLKDELFQLIERESGIIRGKALAQFRNMGDGIRNWIMAEESRRKASIRESIINHIDRIKEELKLELSVSSSCAQYHNNEVANNEGAGTISMDFVWRMLHPRIAEISRSRFESGHYADSVEAALKEINSIVKTLVKNSQGQELDGADLMNRAFSLGNPVILLDDLTTESGKNIQKGYMQIFAGSMTGIRNPKAHENIDIDANRAAHFLFLASLLMFKIDERREHR